MAQRDDDESKYYFKWGAMSWVCVAIGAAFLVLFSTFDTAPLAIGYVGGALIAIVGGIAFALQPKAALDQPVRPMTTKAARKAHSRKASGEGHAGPGASAAGGGRETGSGDGGGNAGGDDTGGGHN